MSKYNIWMATLVYVKLKVDKSASNKNKKASKKKF